MVYFEYDMKQTTEIAILPFKVLELAEIISEKKRLSFEDALFYLYNSDLYQNLTNPNLKLWYHSGAQLYDYLEDEKFEARKSTITKTQAQFLVFCVEQYHLRNNIPTAGVLAMFKTLKIDKFLAKNYEVLHSQSTEYILHEIDLFIRKRR